MFSLAPNLVPFTGGFSETRNIRTRMVHLGQPWSLWSKDFCCWVYSGYLGHFGEICTFGIVGNWKFAAVPVAAVTLEQGVATLMCLTEVSSEQTNMKHYETVCRLMFDLSLSIYTWKDQSRQETTKDSKSFVDIAKPGISQQRSESAHNVMIVKLNTDCQFLSCECHLTFCSCSHM